MTARPDRDAAADERFLAKLFEFEVCEFCGWDADKHTVSTVPHVGRQFALCSDPIPEDMPDREAEQELARRMAASTEGGKRK